jgi:hypothetical protein
MFVANELANAVDNISLKDNDFKANLIKTLKEKNITKYGNISITKTLVDLRLTFIFLKRKLNLIRWIEIGFPKEDITFDFILTREISLILIASLHHLIVNQQERKEKNKQTVTSHCKIGYGSKQANNCQ